MSGMEIERKFLVTGRDYRRLAHASRHIRQGYISSAQGRTVRVRLREHTDADGQPVCEAFLTIKGPSADGGLSRYEFEMPIPPDDARQLLALCEPGIIDKTRYLVDSPCGHTFEVDEFHGDNDGLVMAEVELGAPDEPFQRPAFLGREVTGDRRYYNSELRRHPYTEWGASAS